MLFYSLLFSLFFSSLPPSTGPYGQVLSTSDDSAVLYLSQDQGASWENFDAGLPEDLQVRNLVEHDGHLYLSSYKYGLFSLAPSADTWEQKSLGLPVNDESFLPISLAVEGDVIVMGTYPDGIYISKNGGGFWRPALFGLPRMPRSLIFTDGYLLAGTDMGLWKSFDYGDSWRRVSEDVTSINALTVFEDQLFIASQNGLGIWQDDQIEWSDAKSNWAILQLVVEGEYVYAMNYRNEIFRSKDGLNWSTPATEPGQREYDNLPEALWNGFRPEPPTNLPTGPIQATSRGWIMGFDTGC